MRNPIVIYSRMVLNGMLLERAQNAGCQVHRSRIVAVDTSGEKPRYSIEGEWRTADFLVLAAGARNQLLPGTRALQKDELEITQGYFIPQPADSIIIKFLPHFDGYIWSFPRCDHLSVGISAAAWPRTIKTNFALTCKCLSASKNFPPKPRASTAMFFPLHKFRHFRSAQSSAKIGRW